VYYRGGRVYNESVQHLAWSLVLCGAALAATVPTGPKVGESAPEFRLQDQDGNWRTLQSVTGPKGLMLVFFRSADW
jgi:hypothetical protein